MTLKNLSKAALKKVFPLVFLKNIKGLSKAVVSYYPEYLFGNGRIKMLRHVTMEVTFRCNCRCQMCPLYGVQTNRGEELLKVIKENEELSLKEYKRLFHDLKKLGTRSVTFTGGEAFLRKDMLDITMLARNLNIDVSFTTDGGLITREIARWIVALGVKSVTISLDGPKDVHEKIRRSKIFDNIMDAVDYIKEEKKKQDSLNPSISFLCTVSALNQNHISELVEIASNKELPLTIDPIIFTDQQIWESTKKAVNDDFIKKESFIMPEEIGKVDVDILEKELEKMSLLAAKMEQSVYVSISGKSSRKRFFEDPQYSVVNKCFAPWYSCRIDPYGNVYPCSISISLGNIRETSIGDIVNGEKFVTFRKKLKENSLFPFCKKCCTLYSHNSFWNYIPKI